MHHVFVPTNPIILLFCTKYIWKESTLVFLNRALSFPSYISFCNLYIICTFFCHSILTYLLTFWMFPTGVPGGMPGETNAPGHHPEGSAPWPLFDLCFFAIIFVFKIALEGLEEGIYSFPDTPREPLEGLKTSLLFLGINWKWLFRGGGHFAVLALGSTGATITTDDPHYSKLMTGLLKPNWTSQDIF